MTVRRFALAILGGHDRLALAAADQRLKAMPVDAERDQVIDHRAGAAQAKRLVVSIRANQVGVAVDREPDLRELPDPGGLPAQGRPGLFVQPRCRRRR